MFVKSTGRTLKGQQRGGKSARESRKRARVGPERSKHEAQALNGH